MRSPLNSPQNLCLESVLPWEFSAPFLLGTWPFCHPGSTYGPLVAPEERFLRPCENRTSSSGLSFYLLSGLVGCSEEAAGNYGWHWTSVPHLTRANKPKMWEPPSVSLSGQTSSIFHSTLCSQNSKWSPDPFVIQTKHYQSKLTRLENSLLEKG